MLKPSGKSGGIEKGNSIIAHLDSLSHRARLAVSLASVCLYLVLFFFLYPMTGSGTDVTAVLPVVVIGWLWGSRAGTTTGLLGLLVNSEFDAALDEALAERPSLDLDLTSGQHAAPKVKAP